MKKATKTDLTRAEKLLLLQVHRSRIGGAFVTVPYRNPAALSLRNKGILLTRRVGAVSTLHLTKDGRMLASALLRLEGSEKPPAPKTVIKADRSSKVWLVVEYGQEYTKNLRAYVSRSRARGYVKYLQETDGSRKHFPDFIGYRVDGLILVESEETGQGFEETNSAEVVAPTPRKDNSRRRSITP